MIPNMPKKMIPKNAQKDDPKIDQKYDPKNMIPKLTKKMIPKIDQKYDPKDAQN